MSDPSEQTQSAEEASLLEQIEQLKKVNNQLDTQLKLQSSNPSGTSDLFQLVLDNIPIRVFWKDKRSVYLGANASFLSDAKQQSQEDLAGKTDYELPWSEAEAEAFRADDLEVIESGTSKINIEERQTRADGKTGWLRTNKVALKDLSGEVIGVLGTYEDISAFKEQKEALRASEAKLKALFNQTFQFIGLLDAHGTIVMLNATTEERFNIPHGSLTGQHFPDTLFWTHNEATHNRIKEGLEKAQQGELVRFTTTVPTSTGEIIHIDFSLKPVFDCNGSVEFLIPEGRDITDKVIAEQKLKELNENLELRVKRRTSQLELANQQLCEALETLEAAQDELVQSEKMASLGALVSGVAHEVNTPLGVSITAASHIQEVQHKLKQKFDDSKLTKKEFEEFFVSSGEGVKMLTSNLQRASELIRGFKQVAVDQASESLRRIDLEEYLHEIIMSLKPQLKKSRAEIRVEVSEKILWKTYPGNLAQIFTNLLMNSLVHAFEGVRSPKISIQCQAHERFLTLSYADNGCGMTSETLHKIYEPFYTTRRGDGGSGLGMNIVFNIVTQKLKGKIKCKSTLNRGTSFEISLPWNPDQKSSRVTEGEPE